MIYPHPRSRTGELPAIPLRRALTAGQLAADATRRRHLLFLAAGLTLCTAWLSLCVYYIQVHIGWSNLFSLLPHEFAGFGVGALGPPALLLWLTFHHSRDKAMTQAAKAVQDRLPLFSYPSEEGEARVREITDVLRQEAQELTGASDVVATRVRMMSEMLRQQSENLTTASDEAMSQAEAVQAGLERQTAELESVAERVAA